MVVMMMRWRPWPPLLSKKFSVRLVVRRLEGLDLLRPGLPTPHYKEKLTVEVRWKGQKFALGSFRRTGKRNFTKEVDVCFGPSIGSSPNGVVEWDEEFQSFCTLSGYKDNAFLPWDISFTVFNGVSQGGKNKVPVVGSVSLNLAEYVSEAEQKELSLPIALASGAAESHPLLCISLSLLEITTAPEPTDPVQRAVVPVSLPVVLADNVFAEKDDLSAIKAGIRRVKIFTEYVSSGRAKAFLEEEGSEGRCSGRSENEESYPFGLDSLEDTDERESEGTKEESSIRKSFSYGTLAYANCAGGSFFSNTMGKCEDEDWVYYSNRKSDVGCSNVDEFTPSFSEQPLVQSKRSLLPWRKRKLSFRSPKAKGEPLLKKAYAEEGGDDIDFDRRQLSSDESPALGWHKVDEDSLANILSVSEFGDDSFSVGHWKSKEVVSRDGHLKLQAEVFFASIDQRSEKAAGESACTVLVAVIADWFQNNCGLMPIKSQFDSLIREGSTEWRNLCENAAYREWFPDRHFDLETVLQAKIRGLSVVSGKSFIGFFHPEEMDEVRFDFLLGAMSFDNIWDEITSARSKHPGADEPQVYIVSWNDHFFVLKVDTEAYYIIDTLGERLYEGCNQAYILKFDNNTIIQKMPNPTESLDDKSATEQQNVPFPDLKEGVAVLGATEIRLEEPMKSKLEVVCQGKESCKEYIKTFLAAIPIRELQADIKKGLMASTPLHQRLQIEFHYTQCLQPVHEAPAGEFMVASSPTGVSI